MDGETKISSSSQFPIDNSTSLKVEQITPKPLQTFTAPSSPNSYLALQSSNQLDNNNATTGSHLLVNRTSSIVDEQQQKVIDNHFIECNGEKASLKVDSNGHTSLSSAHIQYGKPASAPSPPHRSFSPEPGTSHKQPASVPPPVSPISHQLKKNIQSHTSSPSAIPPNPTQTTLRQGLDEQDSNLHGCNSIIKNIADIVTRVPDQCGLVSALSKVEQMNKGNSPSGSAPTVCSLAPTTVICSTQSTAKPPPRPNSIGQSASPQLPCSVKSEQNSKTNGTDNMWANVYSSQGQQPMVCIF